MMQNTGRWPSSDEAPLLLTVSDVKQFTYCPRIVYFGYCLPVKKKTTFKMEDGTAEHEDTAERERRRSLRAYGLEQGERRFGVHLCSGRLGLTGLLDMVIVTDREVIPVDFKCTTAEPGLNHKYQLTCYALLVEDMWNRPVRRGFVYLIPRKCSREVAITTGMRNLAMRTLARMRTMIRAESMPAATRKKARCLECEYRNYCNDLA